LNRALAALLFTALAGGPAVAYASADSAAPQTVLSPPAMMQAQADDNTVDDNAAPTPAPTPDPFVAEVLKACRDGASGDKGTFKRLTDEGWAPSVDGDTQTPFYQSFSGEKDFGGVGTADLSFSQEVYPTMTEGYCSVSIDSALRQIGIADLSKMTDLTGSLKQTDDGIASTWEVKGATPPVYIQADQHKKDLYFILDVTTLVQKPAAALPYVTPTTTDDNNSDDPPDSDSTNADSGN
jgi:hypothetical protein